MKSQPCADKLTQGCVRHLKLQNRTVAEFQETPAKCQKLRRKSFVGSNTVAAYQRKDTNAPIRLTE